MISVKADKRRRGHGEGTILERPGKNGKISYRAMVLINGKRFTHTAKTRTAANKWIRDTLEKADKGLLPVDGGKITVAAYLDHWLGWTAPSIKPKTVQQYDSVVRLYLKPTLGALKLADLRADHLQSLSATLLSRQPKPLSPRTVQLTLTIMHHALEDAMKKGLTPRNVADAVTKPKVTRKEMHVWTLPEARAFLAGIKGDRWESLYLLALSHGLRAGELFGLKWEDVDLDAGRIQIRRTIQRISKGAGLTVGTPKTARGRRSIALRPGVVAALRQWRKTQLQERLLAGNRWEDSGYVFASRVGTPTEPRHLKDDFDAKIETLGLPKIRVHDLRHSAATLALSQNVHPKVVQEMLGHSTITLTLDTYSHVLPTMQEEAAQVMEKLLA